jgi:hypothetical protein
MNPKQSVFDAAIEHAATTIKHVLKASIAKHSKDFEPVLAQPNGIKRLASEAIPVLLDKAEANAQTVDKGTAILLTTGVAFLVLNIDAISDKVVEIFNNDN